MAALISLYFLIAVVVGLIVAVVSGLVKNKEIQDLEKYKEEAREKINQEYIQRLDYDKVTNNATKYKKTCSVLFPYNGAYGRGFCSSALRKILRTHFFSIKPSDCSLIKIRGDIEVFFEVLTGVDYNAAVEGEHYKFLFEIPLNGNNYVPGISKCFFEYTILCASHLYQNRKLLKSNV